MGLEMKTSISSKGMKSRGCVDMMVQTRMASFTVIEYNDGTRLVLNGRYVFDMVYAGNFKFVILILYNFLVILNYQFPFLLTEKGGGGRIKELRALYPINLSYYQP